MSRVEDEREQARVAARLAEQKRTDEQKKLERGRESAAFSRLVGQARTEGQQGQARVSQEKTAARTAIEHALDHQHTLVHQEAARGARQSSRHAEERAVSDGEESQAWAEYGHSADVRADVGAAVGRKGDAAAGRELADERREQSEAAEHGGSQAGAEAEALRTDADQEGGRQPSNQDQPGSGSSGQPSFRINPALMPAVPVAQAKQESGSERLRKIANELAQRIVERVRVGTNAQGKVEFQIDLRSEVLSGLTVKVSAHRGKISAVFSGSNKEVLKLIEGQSDALKKALDARGLSLEELKIEARS